MSNPVEVKALHFAYPGEPPFISDLSITLDRGSRCLLVGANGSGKTTLLRILAGKHMVGGKNVVRILGRSAFHDTSLVCDGHLAYLGDSWSKTVSCAGEIALQGDFSAEDMIFGVEDVDPDRRAKLIDLLDIDLEWRMHKVSDGQRRRVQICMGLLLPFQVLLLDEVTVDLDVVARLDLLSFFLEECEERGATLVYATHIFDGLESWATHIAHIEEGKLQRLQKISDISEFQTLLSSKLLSVVESWLRAYRDQDRKPAAAKIHQVESCIKPAGVSLFTSGRHLAWYR